MTFLTPSSSSFLIPVAASPVFLAFSISRSALSLSFTKPAAFLFRDSTDSAGVGVVAVVAIVGVAFAVVPVSIVDAPRASSFLLIAMI